MTSGSSTPTRRAGSIRNLVNNSQYQSPFTPTQNFIPGPKHFKKTQDELIQERDDNHHLEVDLVKTFREIHCARCLTVIRPKNQFLMLSIIRPFLDGRFKSVNTNLCYVCLGELVKEVTPEEIERQTKERLSRQVMNAV